MFVKQQNTEWNINIYLIKTKVCFRVILVKGFLFVSFFESDFKNVISKSDSLDF